MATDCIVIYHLDDFGFDYFLKLLNIKINQIRDCLTSLQGLKCYGRCKAQERL